MGTKEQSIFNRREGLQKALSIYLQKSSVSGVSFIIGTKYVAVRTIWTVLLFSALIGMTVHLSLLLQQYMSYQKQSSTDLHFSILPLPAVSFCNVNPIRMSQIHLASPQLAKLVTSFDPEKINKLKDQLPVGADGRMDQIKTGLPAVNNRFIFALCVFLIIPAPGRLEFAEQYFEDSKICGTFEDLTHSASCTTSVEARSAMECYSKCLQIPATCIGSVFHSETNTCHLLYLCDYTSDNTRACKENENQVQVFRKSCLNGGVFTDKRDIVCLCANGYIGDYCDRLATHCKDVLGFGYKRATERTVWIDYKGRVQKMVCTTTSTYYSIGISSNDGKESRNFTWNDYEKGYYIDSDNYWLGLENMHSLLEPQLPDSKMRMIVSFANETGRYKDYVYYYGFGVMNAAHSYSLFFTDYQLENTQAHGGIESPLKNCFLPGETIPFSTWDNDQDLDQGRNCAGLAGAGWWFNTCGTIPDCNPLGLSVNTLPAPAPTHAHIALKGLDMIHSPWGTSFEKIHLALFVKP